MARTLDAWRDRLLAKTGSSEDTPFGPDALVYKIQGKMFALLGLGYRLTLNLKCDPQDALILRDAFTCVTPGYHMNKKHWNTVDLTTGLDEALIDEWIDDSFELVVRTLPKKTANTIAGPVSAGDQG